MTNINAMVARLCGLAQGSHLYTIVDQASAPRAVAELSGATPVAGASCLFDGALTDRAEAAAPWLLPTLAAPNNHHLLRRSAYLAVDKPAVSWIVSPLDTPTLLTRLARRLDVRLEGGTELLLLYFDPRILADVHTSLAPNHREAFFAIGSHWCFIDRDGALAELNLPGAPERDPLLPPLTLAPAEEAALLLTCEAGQVLTTGLQALPDLLKRLRGSERYALARRACQQAEAAGLQPVGHKVQLLAWAALHGVDYFDSEDWPTHRAQIQADPARLGALLESRM